MDNTVNSVVRQSVLVEDSFEDERDVEFPCFSVGYFASAFT